LWTRIAFTIQEHYVKELMDFPVTKPKTVPHGWMASANCAGMDPNDFFPERGDYYGLRAAKAVCAGCEVRAECLEYALDSPIEKFGIWGGVGDMDRRRMRVSRSMARRNTLSA
jgi:WhiB family redox-sensing transcriptional regulator